MSDNDGSRIELGVLVSAVSSHWIRSEFILVYSESEKHRYYDFVLLHTETTTLT